MLSNVYPFSAIVGQEQLKQALILNVVNPAIGGVLIRGEKGTAKSTAVRALAALLPEIRVIEGCPFSCDPDRPEDWCTFCCSRSNGFRISLRRIPVVTLPLNATEDRVVGGIDFNRAVQTGTRQLQPGILAKAHRGILYVDEVNLLDDHIVDLILDAAVSGRNRIEREGISFTHPARFILVGTMNPEEGALRPQLLDRFGLCVEVVSEKDRDRRAELMLRREAYDTNPAEFIRRYQKGDEEVAGRIRSARKLIPDVTLAPHLRSLIANICSENHVAGHRADLVIEQTARALSALNGHLRVSVHDIREVSILALLHRRRETSSPPPPPQEPDHPHQHPAETDSEETRESEAEKQGDEMDQGSSLEEIAPSPDAKEPESDPQAQGQDRKGHAMERIFEVGETFKVKRFAAPKDRLYRRGSGRRSRTRTAQRQGRYVRSTMHRNTGDVALDATLRAAAPYQLRRKSGLCNRLAVVLRPEDIREKIREKRVGDFLLFVVDASGSMGARGRMIAAKGAIMSLLLDAYQKRDRIAMISFRKDEAAINLPPTPSIDLAATLLREMPVGGRTPLSAALVKSYEMLRTYFLREPTARPIMILITDGKANVALGRQKPFDEACLVAEKLTRDSRIQSIVVDTEGKGIVRFGLARKLAAIMNARYFAIEDLKADTLVHIVKETLQ